VAVTKLHERASFGAADRYIIIREIGRGGAATVYLAEDVKHGRVVALKLLHQELAAELGAERFLREIHLLAQLHHPHILPLFDSGVVHGALYYVMPFVDGESLRGLLYRRGRLDAAEAITIVEEVADALAYAHAHNVVHRDVKPENIMLADGHALVADFGVARAIRRASGEQRMTAAGMTVGTPAYMSPEQASGEPHIDGRADQYALACMLFEMLTGAPPFIGPTAQAVIAQRFTGSVPSVRERRPELSHAIEAALRRAFSVVPAERYDDVSDFARALSAPAPSLAPVPTIAARRPWWQLW
jgi:serine/threonine-protein kinase